MYRELVLQKLVKFILIFNIHMQFRLPPLQFIHTSSAITIHISAGFYCCTLLWRLCTAQAFENTEKSVAQAEYHLNFAIAFSLPHVYFPFKYSNTFFLLYFPSIRTQHPLNKCISILYV